MANLDKDQVIADFTQAYTQANGKAPAIEAKSGWYSVDGGKNVRLAQLQEMTEAIKGDAKPLKKAADKAPTAKTKTAKATKTAKKSGFSVKAYYAEQLKNKAPGATLPR